MRVSTPNYIMAKLKIPYNKPRLEAIWASIFVDVPLTQETSVKETYRDEVNLRLDFLATSAVPNRIGTARVDFFWNLDDLNSTDDDTLFNLLRSRVIEVCPYVARFLV